MVPKFLENPIVIGPENALFLGILQADAGG
jgi:hypothetical protein